MNEDRSDGSDGQASPPSPNQRSLDFVYWVYGDQRDHTFLAGSIPNDKPVRKVGYYSDDLLRQLPFNERHHVSSAVYKLREDGTRDEKDITAVPCIVFDDIGKVAPPGTVSIAGKIEIDESEFACLPDPSWIIETSKGKYQYGYAFDEMLEVGLAEALHKRLKAHPVLGAGLHSLGQYFRLPSGRNTKPGQNFPTRLIHVGEKHSFQAFCQGFDIDIDLAMVSPKAKAQPAAGLEQIPLEVVSAILEVLINDSYFNDRDIWIRVLHACYGANPESFEVVDEWSQKHLSYDATETARVWESIEATGTSASASTLRRIVEERYGRDSDEYRKVAIDIAFDELPPETRKAAPEQSKKVGFMATPFMLPVARNLPPREWLYGKFYIRKFVSGMVSPGGVGKSSLAFVEAASMATGKELLGVRPRKPFRVWLWNGEDPWDELERRLTAVALHYGLAGTDFGDRLFLDSGRRQGLVVAKTVKGDLEVQAPVIKALVSEIKRLGIDVMMIDPFISCHQVPENSNDAIDAVVKEWGRVAETAGCSILLVHHARKVMPGMERTGEDSRGASAFRDGVRVLRIVNEMTETFAVKWGVVNRKAHFRTTDDKGSMSPARIDDDWYRFVSVGLGNGDPFPADGGDPIAEDSVGVVTKWVAPVALDGVEDCDVVAVMGALAKKGVGHWRQSSQSPDWAGREVALVLGIDIGLDAAGDMKNTAGLSPKEAQGRQKVRGLIDGWLADGSLKIVEETDRSKSRHSRRYVEVVEISNTQNVTE